MADPNRIDVVVALNATAAAATAVAVRWLFFSF